MERSEMIGGRQAKGRSRAGVALVVLALLLLLVAAGQVHAAEAPTRGEYVTLLESTCEPGAEATRQTMRGARDDIRASRLEVAAAKFSRATRIFGSTVQRIAAVPRPPADAERLRKWFVYLNRQEDYLGRITAQLRARHAVKAQRLTARFIHSGNLANNVVLAFGFHFCSFKFSRYG
jgi:hypothetical protein